jgi:antitoxin (DNA-binding transcriptional repressor) of toxin-antitoxin stability system
MGGIVPPRQPDVLAVFGSSVQPQSRARERRQLTCRNPERTFHVYISEDPMKDVKVTVLRQKLPEYLARVRRGERVRVTSRGQVIAEIAPPSAAKDDAEAARKRLRGSVRRYERPLDPVIDPGEWDANR